MKTKYIILFMPLIMMACNGEKSVTENNHMISDKFTEAVKTINPQIKIIEKEIVLNGKVVSDPDKTINYSSLLDGVIIKSNFKFGQYVKKGEPMLEIRSSELSRLQSELIVAKRNLESSETKFKNQMISEPEYISVKAEMERIKDELELYGESKGNGIFEIKSPSSGFVVYKFGHTGTPFTAGENLFTVADINTVRVEANIYAGNLQFIEEGQSAELTSIAYPDHIFKGKINYVSQIFDPEDRTLKAHINIENKDLKLKPEMSMMIKIVAPEKISMTSVPKESLIFDNNSYYVVVKNNEYEIRSVDIYQNNNSVSYISSGIKEKDNVVISNQLLIYNELKGK